MGDFEFITVKGNPKFTKWRQAVRQKAHYKCIDTLKFEEKSFDYENMVGVMAAMQILTENIAKAKKPASLYDYFKECYFPKWALKRWPVKYNEINIKVLYPNLTYQDEKVIFKAV